MATLENAGNQKRSRRCSRTPIELLLNCSNAIFDERPETAVKIQSCSEILFGRSRVSLEQTRQAAVGIRLCSVRIDLEGPVVVHQRSRHFLGQRSNLCAIWTREDFRAPTRLR
jgi:hypothetical protein